MQSSYIVSFFEEKLRHKNVNCVEKAKLNAIFCLFADITCGANRLLMLLHLVIITDGIRETCGYWILKLC